MRRTASVTALLVCLLVPAAAHASGQAVIKDCTDNGRIDGRYSAGDYKAALRDLPTDVAEYTDCGDQIAAAQRRGATRQNTSKNGSGGSGGSSSGGSGGGSGSGGSGGSGTGAGAASTDSPIADPANLSKGEKAALASAAAQKASPVTLGSDAVTPGASGLAGEAVRNAIPTPLLIVLLLVGLAAAAVGVYRLRSQAPQITNAAKSLKQRVGGRGVA